MPTENNNQSTIGIDYDALIKWFEENWRSQECPICHSSSWNIEETPFRLERLVMVGQPVHGAPFLGLISVTCKKCAYVRLFDGFQIGVIKFYPGNHDDK